MSMSPSFTLPSSLLSSVIVSPVLTGIVASSEGRVGRRCPEEVPERRTSRNKPQNAGFKPRNGTQLPCCYRRQQQPLMRSSRSFKYYSLVTMNRGYEVTYEATFCAGSLRETCFLHVPRWSLLSLQRQLCSKFSKNIRRCCILLDYM